MTVIGTLHRLIRERGYTVLEETDDEIVTDKALILISNEKMNIAFIKALVSRLHENDTHHVIVVHTTAITSSARSITENTPYNIGFFEASTLVFCILDHDLVPKHTKVVPSDADWKYCRKEIGNIPLLLKTDPVARFMGFKAGDIVRITRDVNLPVKYRITV